MLPLLPAVTAAATSLGQGAGMDSLAMRALCQRMLPLLSHRKLPGGRCAAVYQIAAHGAQHSLGAHEWELFAEEVRGGRQLG